MDYSKTVNLPQTSMPMKADLPKREPGWVDFWQKNKIYEQMLAARKDRNKYVLHDGPPYANGHLHMGHALNKILKDIIVKSRALAGHYAPYVPGWDCHGLPIEHALMKELGLNKHSVDVVDFRKKAAEFALKFMDIQRTEFKRLGIFGDWDHPYLTLTPSYEGAILRVFRELFKKDLIYRSMKPVQWCWHCETALAEAEVEYENKESPAIYVKFKVTQVGDANPNAAVFLKSQNLFVIIWTTTPWTLPGNVGLMVHPQLEYAVVHLKSKDENWVIAKGLARNLLEEKLKMSPADYEIRQTFKGETLCGWKCDRIFPGVGGSEFKKSNLDQKLSAVVMSDQVSAEDGSGIVHTAPGHGEIDYVVGHVQNGLPVVSPVNDAGKFTSDVNHDGLKDLFVLNKGNKKILEILKERGLLIHEEKIQHSYPHCWRCKNPVIFRATHQWFLQIDAPSKGGTLRSDLQNEIEKSVQWVPSYGKNRIGGMIAQRPDWCLSRQRIWGVPIPIFYCKQCNEPLVNDNSLNVIEEQVEVEGSDIWFERDAAELLKHAKAFKCDKCGAGDFTKGSDILDVWFDSGSSHEAVLKGREKTAVGNEWSAELAWPADLYLEGSDQHRGWFQSSLITSVGMHGRPPYKGVLTHGFIVDGEGKKMSKSLGNVIAPEDILKEYGADILRLWVSASDYREDIRLSKDILKGVAENYRKIRNTLRYLIGNISDFDPQKDAVAYDQLLEIDRWALLKLGRAIAGCKKAYDAYEFHRAAVAMVEFCVLDCSSFYFDILKDRLYTYKRDGTARRAAQTVLHEILSGILRIFAPILSFTCEEVWQLGLEKNFWKEKSVFLVDFSQIPARWLDEKIEQKWESVKKIKEKVNLSLEAARKTGDIGSSLEARVVLSGGGPEVKELLLQVGRDLPMIFIVSQVETQNGAGEFEIKVQKAAGSKCARCWRYEETVGKDSAHPSLCLRCREAISELPV